MTICRADITKTAQALEPPSSIDRPADYSNHFFPKSIIYRTFHGGSDLPQILSALGGV